MRHKLLVAAIVGAAVFGAPRLVVAEECNVDTVVEHCNKAFPQTFLSEPLRGWCYILGLANCAASQ